MKKDETQKKPVGLRLAPDEESFLISLSDKKTATDGLRVLLQWAMSEKKPPCSLEEAHSRLAHNFKSALALFHEQPRSVVSEDILRECLMLLSAIWVGVPQKTDEDISVATAQSNAFEAKIVDRAFDLTDTLMRHALPESAAARNPQVVRQRLAGSRDLLISSLHAFAKDNPPKSENAS